MEESDQGWTNSDKDGQRVKRIKGQTRMIPERQRMNIEQSNIERERKPRVDRE